VVFTVLEALRGNACIGILAFKTIGMRMGHISINIR